MMPVMKPKPEWTYKPRKSSTANLRDLLVKGKGMTEMQAVYAAWSFGLRWFKEINMPLLIQPLSRLVPFPTYSVPTLGVSDKMIVAVNPKYVLDAPSSRVAAMLFHELGHPWLRHKEFADAMIAIAQSRDEASPAQIAEIRKLVNLLGDACINEMGQDTGLDMQETWIYPENLERPQPRNLVLPQRWKLWHETVPLTPPPPPPPPPPGPGPTPPPGNQPGNPPPGGQPGPGGNDPGQPGGNQPEQGNQPGENGNQPGGQPGQGQPGHGPDCGSGAGGEKQAWEKEAEAAGINGRSEAEKTEWVREIARAVKETQKTAGNMPGSMTRWADEVLKPPKRNWRAEFRKELSRNDNIVMDSGDDDLFDGRNKAQGGIGHGPGSATLVSDYRAVPKIAFGLDTSGSMGSGAVIRALSEADAIIKAVCHGEKLTFLACDAEVHSQVKCANVNEMKKHIKGGGGTDFRPLFTALEKLPRSARPDVFVFVTDTCGPWPTRKPKGMKTIVVAVECTKATAERDVPKWAKLIHVEE